MTVGATGERPQVVRQRFTGQRTGGNHRDLTIGRKCLLLPQFNRHQRVLIQGLSERSAVPATIDGESTAGGNRMSIGCADHERSQTPEFLLEQTSRTITAERSKTVAADQLGEIAAVVRR